MTFLNSATVARDTLAMAHTSIGIPGDIVSESVGDIRWNPQHGEALTLLDHPAGMEVRRKELEADCLGSIITTMAGYDTGAALRAYREVMAPLERQQNAARVAIFFLGGGFTASEYPPADDKIRRVESAAYDIDVRRRVLGQSVTRETIREICGAAP